MQFSLCLQCKVDITNKHRGAKFCSRSCGATYNNAKRGRTKKICNNCSTPHDKTGKYCDQKCATEYHMKTTASQRFEKGEITDRRALRRVMIHQRGYQCEDDRCNRSEWNGEPIPLEVHHIDGNAGNNMPDNLQMLCCNCHGMTHQSLGGNRGNGRKSRGLPTHETFVHLSANYTTSWLTPQTPMMINHRRSSHR